MKDMRLIHQGHDPDVAGPRALGEALAERRLLERKLAELTR
jgi:hypothetical protein